MLLKEEELEKANSSNQDELITNFLRKSVIHSMEHPYLSKKHKRIAKIGVFSWNFERKLLFLQKFHK